MEEEILFLREEVMCTGCSNEKNKWPKNACKIYPMPERQFTRIGGCAADSRNKEKSKIKNDFKLNPIKASKRGEVK